MGDWDPAAAVTVLDIPDGRIHILTSPDEGERVNSLVIESENALVLIDAPLIRPAAHALRALADSLGKPIDRIIVTHSHPDHWFGLESFRDVPIYALAAVAAEIEVVGEGYIAFKKSQQGDLIPDEKTVPTGVIEPGELIIDGVRWCFEAVSQAEGSVMLVASLPDSRVLLAQDLVYNRVHLYIGETAPDGTRCFDGWLAALAAVDRNAYDIVIPGHGKAGGIELIDPVIEYLHAAREIVASLTTGEEYIAAAKAAYPDWEVDEMLELSAFFLFNQVG